MNNTFTPAPPPIGGWLIFVGYRLLSFLSDSILLFVSGVSGHVFFSYLSFIIAMVYLAFSVYGAHLFFTRKNLFKLVYAVLIGMNIAFSLLTVFLNEPNTSAITWDQMIPSIIVFGIDVVTVVGLFLSKRSKKTFVYGKDETDKTCLLNERTDAPLSIYGLLILVGAVLANLLNQALSVVVAGFAAGVAWIILLYGAYLAATVFGIILFFNRKRLFRKVFISLCIVPVALTLLPFTGAFAGPDFDAGSYMGQVFLPLILYALLIPYTVMSQRVNRTFVFDTRPFWNVGGNFAGGGSNAGGDTTEAIEFPADGSPHADENALGEEDSDPSSGD